MQTKMFTKSTKILTAILALVLLSVTVLFAGCGASNISFNDLSNTAKKAASTYYADHVNYEKFAETTYSYDMNAEESQTVELKYKKTESATELTTEKFTNTANYKLNVTLAVKHVGDDIAIKMVMDEKNNQTINEVDATKQTLKTSSNEYTGKITYIIAPKAGATADATTYFMTRTEKTTSSVAGDETVDLKEYTQFENKTAYVNAINEVLSVLNHNYVYSPFFSVVGTPEIAIMLGNAFDCTKDGNTVSLKVDMSSLDIDDEDYTITDIKSNGSMNFVNDKVDSLVMEYITSSDNESSSTKINFVITNEADADTTITTTNYEEAENSLLQKMGDEMPEIVSIIDLFAA